MEWEKYKRVAEACLKHVNGYGLTIVARGPSRKIWFPVWGSETGRQRPILYDFKYVADSYVIKLSLGGGKIIVEAAEADDRKEFQTWNEVVNYLANFFQLRCIESVKVIKFIEEKIL